MSVSIAMDAEIRVCLLEVLSYIFICRADDSSAEAVNTAIVKSILLFYDFSFCGVLQMQQVRSLTSNQKT